MSAIINDTVGTLVAHAYKNPTTCLAVILGTGSVPIINIRMLRMLKKYLIYKSNFILIIDGRGLFLNQEI